MALSDAANVGRALGEGLCRALKLAFK